jgi:hypothetical protein
LAKDKDHKAKHDNHFLVKKVKKQVEDLKQATKMIELLQKNIYDMKVDPPLNQ